MYEDFLWNAPAVHTIVQEMHTRFSTNEYLVIGFLERFAVKQAIVQ